MKQVNKERDLVQTVVFLTQCVPTPVANELLQICSQDITKSNTFEKDPHYFYCF